MALPAVLSVILAILAWWPSILAQNVTEAGLVATGASGTAASLATSTSSAPPFCGTSASDWYMDPATAMRLADLFCLELYQPDNFPDPGTIFWDRHYATELQPAAGSPNYTAITLSGIIAEMSLFRGNTTVLDGTIQVHGTLEQCGRDDCRSIMRHTIRQCQRNSHSIGGDSMFFSDCGIYQLIIANCSGNWWDPDCNKWHVLYPDVGKSRNESMAGSVPARNSTVQLRRASNGM